MGIFKQIDRDIEIEVDGHVFKGRLPLPSDERNIVVNVSRRLGGANLNSIPDEIYFLEKAVSTLNYCLDVDEDWANNPDLDLTLRVYNKFREAQDELQERLKKNNHSGGNKGTPGRSGDDPQLIPDEGIQDKPKRKYNA